MGRVVEMVERREVSPVRLVARRGEKGGPEGIRTLDLSIISRVL
jgi:hypothetical protein